MELWFFPKNVFPNLPKCISCFWKNSSGIYFSCRVPRCHFKFNSNMNPRVSFTSKLNELLLILTFCCLGSLTERWRASIINSNIFLLIISYCYRTRCTKVREHSARATAITPVVPNISRHAANMDFFFPFHCNINPNNGLTLLSIYNQFSSAVFI